MPALLRRGLRALAAAVFMLALLPATPRAQTIDPLVRDSLAALDALTAGEGCRLLDAADGDPANGVELGYRFCDDGLPPAGGGEGGIPVPVKYRARDGDDHTGLPPPATGDEVTSADERDDLRPEVANRITLDVDLSLPVTPAPARGYPVVVFMHGCCGGNKKSWEAATIDAPGELWHHSNAWFAARGYVVITYTARGFRDANDRGSTGTTQLDSRRYEINDYQYLVGLLADHDAAERAAGRVPRFNVDPLRVAAVGGSYGGGFAWLALTDPRWDSPAFGIDMALGAVLTRYGWTDLVASLVPNGADHDRDPQTGRSFVAPSSPDQALSRAPIGVEKMSIVAGLYATGRNLSTNHTTFPEHLDRTYVRLQAGEPYEGDATVEATLDSFLADRSAYYQEGFWARVAQGLRVPVFAAGTWTDPLFPTIETIRFYNKLKSLDRRYPIELYLGDFQHLTAQNKPKEWADLCGQEHRICTIDDFRRADGRLDFSNSPQRVRKGINTRMAEFLDHVLLGRGPRPAYGVSATTTICPANADQLHPADEPGIEHRARTWRALAPLRARFTWDSGGVLTPAGPDPHALLADPVVGSRQADKCYTTPLTQAGPGIVQLASEVLEEPFTMMGIPTVRAELSAPLRGYWVAARLFDLSSEGALTLVARGVCRTGTGNDCSVFDLSGNGWVFERAHRVVLQLTQADVPHLRPSNLSSVVQVGAVALEIPVAVARNRQDFRTRRSRLRPRP
jgi:acetyl esterase/lipase